MAAGPPPRSLFVMDEERDNSFMKKLEDHPHPSFVPSDAEGQSATVNDDDEENARVASSSSSTRPDSEVHLDLDVEARQNAAAKPTTLWTRLQAGWEEVEDHLAEWFGLNQSKYQWAVDELLERQLAGDQPASKANVDELQMGNIQEQSMQRDSGGSKS